MTLEELVEARVVLEKKISALVNEFQAATGLRVDDVRVRANEVTSIHDDRERFRYVTEVVVRL